MFVLRSKALPAALCGMVRAMYAQMETLLEVCGILVATVALLSGIRQGCRTIGSLFVLALDPLILWMLWHTSLYSARLVAGAGDSAFVVGHLHARLRLGLRTSKCGAIALWSGLMADAARALEGEGVFFFSEFRIPPSVRYSRLAPSRPPISEMGRRRQSAAEPRTWQHLALVFQRAWHCSTSAFWA